VARTWPRASSAAAQRPQPLPPQRQPAAAAPVAALRRAQRAAARAAAVRCCDPLRKTLRSAHCDRSKNRISAALNPPFPLRHSCPAHHGVSSLRTTAYHACAPRPIVPADHGLWSLRTTAFRPCDNRPRRSAAGTMPASAASFPAGTLIHPPCTRTRRESRCFIMGSLC